MNNPQLDQAVAELRAFMEQQPVGEMIYCQAAADFMGISRVMTLAAADMLAMEGMCTLYLLCFLPGEDLPICTPVLEITKLVYDETDDYLFEAGFSRI